MSVVQVTDLRIVDSTGHPVLDGVSLALQPGDRVGVIGESGAGKSTLALAVLGVVRPGLRRASGGVTVLGHDVMGMRERPRRALRRRHTAWLGQDPAAALTPTMSVGRQVAEILGDAAGVAGRLEALGLPGDAEFRSRLPHQLSGGQQRRVALARALAARPDLVVLDEPTAGLDAESGDTVVRALLDLQRERGFALLVISHDVGLVARACDRLVVVEAGRVVERGRCAEVLAAAEHPHTCAVVAAQSGPAAPRPVPEPATPVLVAAGLGAHFGSAPVLCEVDMAVSPGECLAVVGRSGSGKTTLARCLVGLHTRSAGSVRLDGELLAGRAVDRAPATRGRIQLVPQDPYGSLHPRRSVGAAIARPMRLLHGVDGREADAAVADLLRRVGLDPAFAARRPAELSGGQRQRVALARALAARPDVLVCDEITSALDATVAGSVLDLVDTLRRDLDLAVVLITHDMRAVRRAADRVLTLDAGRVRGPGPLIATPPPLSWSV